MVSTSTSNSSTSTASSKTYGKRADIAKELYLTNSANREYKLKKMKVLEEDSERREAEHASLQMDACLGRYQRLKTDIRDLKKMLTLEKDPEEIEDLKAQIERLQKYALKCEQQLDQEML